MHVSVGVQCPLESMSVESSSVWSGIAGDKRRGRIGAVIAIVDACPERKTFGRC